MSLDETMKHVFITENYTEASSIIHSTTMIALTTSQLVEGYQNYSFRNSRNQLNGNSVNANHTKTVQ